MDWLKDKKNQPIVITIFAVIIVGAVVAMYFMNSGGSGGSEVAPPTTDAAVPAPAPGADPMGVPATDPLTGAPAAPAAAAAKPADTAPAGGAVPMEAYRADPFQAPGYKPPKTPKFRPKPRIPDLPMFNISRVEKAQPPGVEQDKPQPPRRMGGLILNNGVFAIIETNGTCEIVQPGDRLKDGLAVVDRIENDRIVLKTTDQIPKYLVVRMASAPRTASNNQGATGGVDPMRPGRGNRNRNLGPMPGGPMDMPGPEPM